MLNVLLTTSSLALLVRTTRYVLFVLETALSNDLLVIVVSPLAQYYHLEPIPSYFKPPPLQDQSPLNQDGYWSDNKNVIDPGYSDEGKWTTTDPTPKDNGWLLCIDLDLV